MSPPRWCLKPLAAALILSLNLPQPALALRPVGLEEADPALKTHIEHALTGLAMAAGLEEWSRLGGQIVEGFQKILREGPSLEELRQRTRALPAVAQGAYFEDPYVLWRLHQIARQGLDDEVQRVLQWLQQFVSFEAIQPLWADGHSPWAHEFLEAMAKLMKMFETPESVSKINDDRRWGYLSDHFLRAVLLISPKVFDEIIDEAASAMDANELWRIRDHLEQDIDVDASVRARLLQAFDDLQSPSLSERVSPDEVVRRFAMEFGESVVGKVARTLEAGSRPELQPWRQRIDPDQWRHPEQVETIMMWVARYDFPVRFDLLKMAVEEFAGMQARGMPYQQMAQVFEHSALLPRQYDFFSLPEAIAALQRLFNPDLRAHIQWFLDVPDDRGDLSPGEIGYMGRGRYASDQENLYRLVRFFEQLDPRIIAKRSEMTFHDFVDLVQGLKWDFMQGGDEGSSPSATGLEDATVARDVFSVQY